MLRSARPLLNNVVRITSKEQFEALKQSTAKCLVTYHTAKFSTASHMFADQFSAMATSYPQYQFATVDVDECPHAAYDCEVSDVPAVAVSPVGAKADGAPYGKEEWFAAQAGPELDYVNIFGNAKAHLDALKFAEESPEELAARPGWLFCPNTGTTRRENA